MAPAPLVIAGTGFGKPNTNQTRRTARAQGGHRSADAKSLLSRPASGPPAPSTLPVAKQVGAPESDKEQCATADAQQQ